MQIQWTHCNEVPVDVRSAVEERLHSLGRKRGDLLDVRLVGHASNHHRFGGRELRITGQARGREIVASCERPELGEALNEAIDDFERRVRRVRERRRARG